MEPECSIVMRSVWLFEKTKWLGAKIKHVMIPKIQASGRRWKH